MRQTFVICKYIPYAIAFATLISCALDLYVGEKPRKKLMAKIIYIVEEKKEKKLIDHINNLTSFCCFCWLESSRKN
jgi:hypothetical protein